MPNTTLSDWPTSAALEDFLRELRSLADGPAPTPSDELAALLEGSTRLLASARRRCRYRRTIAGVVIAGSLGAGVNAAAAAAQRAPSASRYVAPRAAPGAPMADVDVASPATRRPAAAPAHPPKPAHLHPQSPLLAISAPAALVPPGPALDAAPTSARHETSGSDASPRDDPTSGGDAGLPTDERGEADGGSLHGGSSGDDSSARPSEGG